MDRRKFLLGSVGVAALGAVGKLAPTPIWEIRTKAVVPMMTLDDYVERIVEPLVKQYERTMIYGNSKYSPTQFTGLIPRVECS